MVITGLTRKVIHLRELRPTESLDFTQALRFCISQKLACFALNFALISSFVKIVGLTYKNLIWTGIEVVITALTRNQVVAQAARGFESHPVRQNALELNNSKAFFISCVLRSFLV